ncbi:MAG TPA: ABC transporter permease [Thermoanaerobaculia bacterium]|nr:ABC transporter permease [Thermoanaerobaculia bacterium]
MSLSNLRLAIRRLAKAPGFTLLTVLILALGIGANSAIFSLVDALLFRDLPVPQPERLVRVGVGEKRGSGSGGSASYPQYLDYRNRAHVFVGLAAFSDGAEIDVSVNGQLPARALGSLVSGNYFQALGVHAARGRLLVPDDDGAPGAHAVMVLSDRMWQRQFGADPGVVGARVRLNREPFTVVGVAPAGFIGVTLEQIPDFWIPVAMFDAALPADAQMKPLERRGFGWLDMIARLRPGATVAQAQAQLDVLSSSRLASNPSQKDRDPRPWTLVVPAAGATVDPDHRTEAIRLAWVLVGVAVLVLLIACAVAAGLILMRGERRQIDLAIRMAIGASRAQVVRELLAEGVLLGAASAFTGIVFAAWATKVFTAIAPAGFSIPVGATSPIIAWRMITFTALSALCSTLLCAFVPARRLTRNDLSVTLQKRDCAPGDRLRHLTLQNAFVVAEVALCTLLLVGAGLLLRTLQKASAIDLGFRARDVMLLRVDVSRQGYTRQEGLDFYRRLVELVRQIPGVKVAAISYHVPVQRQRAETSVELSHFTPRSGEEPMAAFAPVSPGFFDALGIRLLRGRDFIDSDSDAEPAVIVNQAFARQFWPRLDPLQQRVLNIGRQGAPVVGVVATVRSIGVRDADRPFMYVPHRLLYMPAMTLVVRTLADPRPLAAPMRQALAELDPNLPPLELRPLTEHIGAALGQERMLAGCLSAFGLLALALATAGLYAVVSYTTQQRRREFGIRIALGARPNGVLFSIVRRALGLAALGIALGFASALSATRVISHLLFGVQATDGVTFLGIAVLLAVVAASASTVPAARVARLDPVAVLREG